MDSLVAYSIFHLSQILRTKIPTHIASMSRLGKEVVDSAKRSARKGSISPGCKDKRTPQSAGHCSYPSLALTVFAGEIFVLTSQDGTGSSWVYRNVAEEVDPLSSGFTDWQMPAMLGPGSGFSIAM